jgi:hypothetical protein
VGGVLVPGLAPPGQFGGAARLMVCRTAVLHGTHPTRSQLDSYAIFIRAVARTITSRGHI